MDHHEQHHQAHRKEREHKKHEQKLHEQAAERQLRSVHPGWYIGAAVVLILAAVLIWTCYPW
jgi:hypothetical protein